MFMFEYDRLLLLYFQANRDWQPEVIRTALNLGMPARYLGKRNINQKKIMRNIDVTAILHLKSPNAPFRHFLDSKAQNIYFLIYFCFHSRISFRSSKACDQLPFYSPIISPPLIYQQKRAGVDRQTQNNHFRKPTQNPPLCGFRMKRLLTRDLSAEK